MLLRVLGALIAALSVLTAACSPVDPAGARLTSGDPAPTGPASAIQRAEAEGATVTRVVAVSVDGLMPRAIRTLGKSGAPTLHRLIQQGASTLNARTERELTITLPNHTGMVTGRRVDEDHGGHGVTWNDERTDPATVQEAAGHDVASVFTKVHSSERTTGVFASKTKFSLFDRSWDKAVDRYVYRADNARLMRLARRDLVDHRQRAFEFIHLSRPDEAGHGSGWMSQDYLDAVRQVDGLIGDLVATLENHPKTLGNHTVLVVTSDHGGSGVGHDENDRLANYRVPFLVWGPGVAAGRDLYALNDDYRDPGKKRTRYSDDKQPVRNGAVANLVADLLGLEAIKGSEHDAAQDLDWH
jgi:predicted AlkP superfamily pyrophosphatase or phosphodiesterase